MTMNSAFATNKYTMIPVTIDIGLFGKLGDIARALVIERRRLDQKYERFGYGPRITRVELVHTPIEDDDKAVFAVDVLQDGMTRNVKLRFEATESCRRPVEQYRGKRDLSLMVIFIRMRDRFAQIINRISQRIGLLISDMRRHYDFWRRTGHDEPMTPKEIRKWRRKRRHWCHRQSFLPVPAGAW